MPMPMHGLELSFPKSHRPSHGLSHCNILVQITLSSVGTNANTKSSTGVLHRAADKHTLSDKLYFDTNGGQSGFEGCKLEVSNHHRLGSPVGFDTRFVASNPPGFPGREQFFTRRVGSAPHFVAFG